jgi:hypothetical protein
LRCCPLPYTFDDGWKEGTKAVQHNVLAETGKGESPDIPVLQSFPNILPVELLHIRCLADFLVAGTLLQSPIISSGDFRLKARFYVTTFSLPLLNHPIMPPIRTPLAERNSNSHRGPEVSEFKNPYY